MTTQILTTRMEAHPSDSHTLARYLETGGYESLRKALEMEPAAIIEEVKASNIRGRGGAGGTAGGHPARRARRAPARCPRW